MITFAGDFSAIVNSPDLKAMRDANNVRAALEEIAGRAAAIVLDGNVVDLLEELGGMRAALHDDNLDACIEHDIAMIGNLTEQMREVVESHQPIIDALQKGRGKQSR